MKRLLFSIFSILQFTAITSSCKKCVTCTLYYYNASYPVLTSSKYCGSEKDIKAYEAGFKASIPLYSTDSGQIICNQLNE